MYRIIIQAAKAVIGNKSNGRTNEWILREMKWMEIKNYYENQLQNYIYKILNTNNEHYFKYYFTKKKKYKDQKSEQSWSS